MRIVKQNITRLENTKIWSDAAPSARREVSTEVASIGCATGIETALLQRPNNESRAVGLSAVVDVPTLRLVVANTPDATSLVHSRNGLANAWHG